MLNHQEIIIEAERIILNYLFLTLERREDQQGGLLSIISSDDSRLLLRRPIGTFDKRYEDKYRDLSLEKAQRLFRRLSKNHHSSWQSRNARKDAWGGAILAKKIIISFSGLPERHDEAFSLLMAMKLDILNYFEAKKIAVISENEVFDVMHTKCSNDFKLMPYTHGMRGLEKSALRSATA